jgi:hypothetical protein
MLHLRCFSFHFILLVQFSPAVLKHADQIEARLNYFAIKNVKLCAEFEVYLAQKLGINLGLKTHYFSLFVTSDAHVMINNGPKGIDVIKIECYQLEAIP